jgi:glycosyl transferase family 25
MHIPVYVINLTKDVERWRRVEKALLDLGISPIRIRAVNGVKKHELIRRLIRGGFGTKYRPLTPAVLGCALSHVGFWKKVHRRGAPAVVLEDDAELSHSFKDFYFRELPVFLQRCDIVKFEGLFYPKRSVSGPVLCDGQSTKLIVPFYPTAGTAGYALTQHGAEILLGRAKRITEGIDIFLGRYEEHGVVYGETRPMLVKQGDFESNIAPEMIASMMSYKPSLWTRKIGRPLEVIRRSIRRSLAIGRIIILAKFLRPMMTRE